MEAERGWHLVLICAQKKPQQILSGAVQQYFPASYTFSNEFCCPFDPVKVKCTVLPQGGSSSLQWKPEIFCLRKQPKQGSFEALQIATAGVPREELIYREKQERYRPNFNSP